ncbi:MAG: hypothetical protein ACRBEQ_05085 [Hyphomonas sp.]
MKLSHTFAAAIMLLTGLAACGGADAPASPQANTDAAKPENKPRGATGWANQPENRAGTVTATINGEVHTWHVQKSQSEWYSGLDAPQSFVSIYSFQAVDNPIPSVISFDINRSGDKWFAQKIVVRPSNPDIWDFSTSNDGAKTFEVTSASMEGDVMKLTGVFTAAMPALNKIGEDPDMTNILKVENGTFDVSLPARQ